MGDGANVFNTFSFNKWADGKREEEIDKESRRRRAEQIKRLKERLRKERALREAQGDGDLDLDALIEAIQQGEMINMPGQTDVTVVPEEEPAKRKRGVPDELSDDYIFNEINLYASRANGLKANAEPVDMPIPQIASIKKPDPLSFKYNRRNQNNEMIVSEGPNLAHKPNDFKFNRMIQDIPK